MERVDSLIPGMPVGEYYAKSALRMAWRNQSLPEKVKCVIEMQKRAAVFMRLRGKVAFVWHEDQ